MPQFLIGCIRQDSLLTLWECHYSNMALVLFGSHAYMHAVY